MPNNTPCLMWDRELKKLGIKHKRFENVLRIRYSNVVANVVSRLPRRDIRRRLMLGERIDRMSDKDESDVYERSIHRKSNTNPNNPFSLVLLKIAGFPGKVLRFEGGNLIRNGKHRQAEHFRLIQHYQRRNNNPYHAAIAIPNSVISVTFDRPVSETIGTHPRVVDNRPKFPGFSLISPRKSEKRTKCTPMLYHAYNNKKKIQNRSNVNIPGPKDPEDLMYHIDFVDKLSIQYPSEHVINGVDEEMNQNDDDDEVENMLNSSI